MPHESAVSPLQPIPINLSANHILRITPIMVGHSSSSLTDNISYYLTSLFQDKKKTNSASCDDDRFHSWI